MTSALLRFAFLTPSFVLQALISAVAILIVTATRG